ncbi:MAG: hypothetical protein ACE5FF_17645, partial [Saprospiraceae bacterium]
MRINDLRTIFDLQKEFMQEFPYLRLEFFKDTHLAGQGTKEVTILDGKELVGDVRKVHNRGYIKLDGNLTVGGLEQAFAEIFGLHILIYRKSFGEWIKSYSSEASTL